MKLIGVTITTDASHHPKSKTAAYAFMITADGFRKKSSGVFKIHMDNSNEAEMACIGNAMTALTKYEHVGIFDWVCINTDSKSCIRILKDKRKGKNPIFNATMDIKEELEKYVGRVTLKHVRAHTDKKNARSLANEWCDERAKELMRRELRKSKGGRTKKPKTKRRGRGATTMIAKRKDDQRDRDLNSEYKIKNG